MNRLQGTIAAIRSAGRLTLIDVNIGPDQVSGLIIDTPETNPYLRIGHSVWVVFKESDVALGKSSQGQISISNCLEGVVVGVAHGQLVSRIRLDYKGQHIYATLPNRSLELLPFEIGDKVDILIRINEILLLNQASDEE